MNNIELAHSKGWINKNKPMWWDIEPAEQVIFYESPEEFLKQHFEIKKNEQKRLVQGTNNVLASKIPLEINIGELEFLISTFPLSDSGIDQPIKNPEGSIKSLGMKQFKKRLRADPKKQFLERNEPKDKLDTELAQEFYNKILESENGTSTRYIAHIRGLLDIKETKKQQNTIIFYPLVPTEQHGYIANIQEEIRNAVEHTKYKTSKEYKLKQLDILATEPSIEHKIKSAGETILNAHLLKEQKKSCKDTLYNMLNCKHAGIKDIFKTTQISEEYTFLPSNEFKHKMVKETESPIISYFLVKLKNGKSLPIALTYNKKEIEWPINRGLYLQDTKKGHIIMPYNNLDIAENFSDQISEKENITVLMQSKLTK